MGRFKHYQALFFLGFFYILGFFSFLDSLGFGITRESGRQTFHSDIFLNLPFHSGVHLMFSFRGSYTGLSFTWQSIIPLEEDPKHGSIHLSLQNATRYALTKAKSESLVRKSSARVARTSSSDFSKLIFSPHLLASFLSTRNGNGSFRMYSPPSADSLRPIIRCLSVHPQENLTRLRKIWMEIDSYLHNNNKALTSNQGNIHRVLAQIERYDMPLLFGQIFEYLYYFTLSFP